MTQTTTDAVNFVRPEYEQHQHQVQICNDIYNGIDTAKKYIIQRPLEDYIDYSNRVNISVLNNFVERITTAQAGMIFRKPLTYEDIPERVQEALDNLDIGQFSKEATEWAIRDGVGLIMVDIGVNGGEPYFTHIHRSQLINWDKDADGNFTMAVIVESVPKRDGFVVEYVTQYRHIKENGDIDLWQEVKGQGLVIVESIMTSYDFVPLYEAFISAIPPLYDIAHINIAHLNMESVLDNSTATCMQPSLFTKGLGLDDNTDVKFSTNSTINTDNTDASVEWLELSGQSIPYGVDNIERKAKAMSDRALQIQREGSAKTATQVNTENSESTSRLADISEIIQNTINKAYDAWHKMKYNTHAIGSIEISRDFKSTPDASVIIGLNQGVMAGNISRYTYIKALIDAELINVEDIDEELKRIDSEYIDETIKPADK